MDPTTIENHKPSAARASPSWSLDLKLTPGWFYRALLVIVAVWVLHGFVHAILAACVTAVASWPLYMRFVARLPARMGRNAAPLLFTCLMAVFVLAPLMFAFGALISEAHTLLIEIAAADQRGIVLPAWLQNAPLVGPWLLSRWQNQHPGKLLSWAQQTEPAVLLGWAHSLAQFTAHHAFIVGFTVLLLYFLYQEGEALGREFRRALRQRIGMGVDRYFDLGTRAVRASVNSMLVVALFDGLATALTYALVGVPQAPLWAAITGLLALVPFLGYVAVGALVIHLEMTGAATAAFISLTLGWAILLCGDKVVRPVIARNGVRLPFVWVLMGCLGGFEVLGIVGLVVGPVVLTLAREMWQERVREPAASTVEMETTTPKGQTTVG